MIVLGLDTSGYANAIGVTDGEKVLAEINYEARNDSLEKIVVNIDEALNAAGLSLGDIGGIGVGLGPGSWTGIRVGVTVGKMLALAAGKPVAGVSTFEMLAYAAEGETSLLCPVISTGAGAAVYAAFYRVNGIDIKQHGEYYVGDMTGLAEVINEPVTIIGQGAANYASEIKTVKPGIKIDSMEAVPNGAAVAVLAGRRLVKGERDDPLALAPLYLKESTARAFVNKYAQRAVGD